jgi:hypothetical protein
MALLSDAPGFVSCLDTPLLRISPRDLFTLRDACNGVHIFGAIGSGKTSGSGKALASAYLRAGMGFLVLCAKPEEVALWIKYARENGRARSVVIFDETRGFNFITYELARQGWAGLPNVTECIMRVLEFADHAMGAGGQANDPFWPQAVRQAINYALPAIYAAWGNVTVANIIDFVVSAATKAEQYNDPDFAGQSYAARTLHKMHHAPAVRMPAAEQRPVLEFWFRQYPAIPEKTRGNVSISLSAKLDRFRHGRMRDCFCGHTDIVPEMILNGAIVIMAMSVLTWNEDGNIGQMIFKYMTQRMIESRNGLPPQYRERPVAIWADEAQYFVSVKDDEFLSTCRASRACVVFLTQTLPAYYARLGKDRTDAVDGIVGKFNTHIFHLNACNRTNTFASQLIGRGIQLRSTSGGSFGTNTSRGMAQGTNTNRGTSKNSGASYGPNSGGWNHGDGSSSGSGDNHGTNVGEGQNEGRSWSAAETMDLLVEPSFFAKELKSGGPANDNIVSALWFKTGGSFGGGANALITRFRQ